MGVWVYFIQESFSQKQYNAGSQLKIKKCYHYKTNFVTAIE